ncbi:hypothetical protein [Streptomyces yangpuensis]|uniref:hypothetical protein n=1 Tax=Streptomyces yangpuensis TaxID=1648182 RepID=UPI00382F796B
MVVPAAIAALREHVEHAQAWVPPPGRMDRAENPAVLSTGLRRALAAHGLTRHRVHRLAPALLTVTLDPAHAQALAALLAARRELPRQTPAIEDEPRWGAGPAETATASLAVAYGPWTYGPAIQRGWASGTESRSAPGACGHSPHAVV